MSKKLNSAHARSCYNGFFTLATLQENLSNSVFSSVENFLLRVTGSQSHEAQIPRKMQVNTNLKKKTHTSIIVHYKEFPKEE